MDIEQLNKKLDWLDDERRKDKILIATLQERIATLEDQQPANSQRLQSLEGELARFSTSLIRFEQIESDMSQQRVELARMIQEVDKQGGDRFREIEKIRQADLESLTKSLGETRKSLEVIPEIRKSIQARTEGENRLGRELDETQQSITNYLRSEEEYRRQIKLMEDSTRQDAKRLADLTGEVSALRKRVEEQRGKIDLSADSMRKIDMRINELHSAESERRQGQVVFMEKQNMAVLERDRVWKEWQSRFQTIEGQSANLDVQVQALDATHRAVKKAQESFEEITARFERRINEITEMQRLVEDRFRQEWVSFKADDQKRWTNYSLAQEEQQRELARQMGKIEERLVSLEDLTQEIQDLTHLIVEDTQKRLQHLAAISRDWVEDHDQSIQRSR